MLGVHAVLARLDLLVTIVGEGAAPLKEVAEVLMPRVDDHVRLMIFVLHLLAQLLRFLRNYRSF